MSKGNDATSDYKQQVAEIREQLAAIEHERWSDWQQWMHDQARRDYNADGEPVYSYTVDQISRWQTQVETPYSELSDKEKASDMEQVDRYWPLIAQLIEQEKTKARIEELFRHGTAAFAVGCGKDVEMRLEQLNKEEK